MTLLQEQLNLIAEYGFMCTKINPLTLVHEDGGIATRKAAESLVNCIEINSKLNERLHQLEGNPTSNDFVQAMVQNEKL
jgi:hypothetical protein